MSDYALRPKFYIHILWYIQYHRIKEKRKKENLTKLARMKEWKKSCTLFIFLSSQEREKQKLRRHLRIPEYGHMSLLRNWGTV